MYYGGIIMYCCKNSKEKILNGCIFAVFILCILIIIFLSLAMMPEQKNILTAVAINGNNSEVGTTTIKFSQNDIVVGNALSHVDGSDEIAINENGIYQISYQLYGTSESSGTFNINCLLLVNNTALETTFNEGPVLKQNVNNRMTLSGTVILKLNAGDILKLQAVTIEDITYPRARIDIEKIL